MEVFISIICFILAMFIFIFKIVDTLAIPVFIVFLVLKLCGVIAWSWLMVCLPLIILLGTFILTVIFMLIKEWLDN